MRFLAASLLCFHLASDAAAAADPTPKSPAESLLAAERTLVIGHRGYSSAAPENTLASFDRALSARVDLVELDYHVSSDGTAIVIHDSTLDRTTDAIARWGGKNHLVSRRTAAELTQLLAGDWFQPPFPDQRLVTLGTALEFIQARGMTLVERKAGPAAALVQLLSERRLLNRVVVQAFDWDFLRAYHRLEPHQVLGALGPSGSKNGRKLSDAEKALDRNWLEEVRETGARVVVWNRQVDAEAIRLAHGMGLRVWVYTINETDVAARLIKDGVDGIITDNPDLIRQAIPPKP